MFSYSYDNCIVRGLKLKSVLLTALGILIGEKDEKSAKIIQSILFTQEDLAVDDNFEILIEKNRDEIKGCFDNKNEEIISDKSQIIEFLRQEGFKNARFANMGELATYRKLVSAYLADNMQLSPSETLTNLLHKKAMERTRFLLREKVEARDVYIAQAINSIDDVNAILNLIYARLSEWHGIHFPELKDLVRDNTQYIRLISKTNGAMRADFDERYLSHLSEKRQKTILEAAEKSLGASISQFDIVPISQLATFGVEILKIKDGLESYIEESMKEVAPNLQYLVGSLLGARLISLAGSLENLAKSSSGTIQVLGAEKALFRHLRSGEDPPKHGVIFQSSYIHSAKKHQRGKIARTLAGKLSIAARVDFFSGEFIAPILLQELENRVEEIKSTFPEPSEHQIAQKRKKKRTKPKSGKKTKFAQKGKRKPRKN